METSLNKGRKLIDGKRMKQIITTLSILLHFVGLSQDWLNDKEELKGNVKFVHYKSTTYLSTNKEDWWIENCKYHYNEQGFLIKSNLERKLYYDYHNGVYRIYDEEGTLCLTEYELRDHDTSSTKTYTYDSLDRVIQEYYYRNDFSNTFYYEYDHKGYLSRRYALIRDKDTSDHIYEYDDFGRKIREVDTSYSSVIIKTWKYDIHGNITREISERKKAPKTIAFTIHEDGTHEKKVLDKNPDDKRNYQIDYTYNDNNQIVHEIKKHLDGRVQHDILYEYNERGDVIVKNYLDLKDDGSDRIKLKTKYKYDSYGNWTSKTSYYDGELDQEETRKIKYYQ